jgi:hypothetical protein
MASDSQPNNLQEHRIVETVCPYHLHDGFLIGLLETTVYKDCRNSSIYYSLMQT